MLPSDRPLATPHLPQTKVTTVAISAAAGESIQKLTQMGIQCMQIRPHPHLPRAINTHADLQMFHMELSDILVDEYLFDSVHDKRFRFQKVPERLGRIYPTDVRLNALRLGNRLICNPATVSQTIQNFACEHGLEIVSVKQGYTKCSVCCLTENAIITDDPSICQSAQFFCNDLLLVSKGSIRLNGYDYGFIGGCCGLIEKDLIAWNGRIESHSDGEAIKQFLIKHKIRSVNLNDGPLTDIGGILPLREEQP